ncbi:hypothetical protein LG3211_3639 [Lysobacter gummosus]|nr:hypothetical protein LG3211_3639 [Lysobacter gummosus]
MLLLSSSDIRFLRYVPRGGGTKGGSLTWKTVSGGASRERSGGILNAGFGAREHGWLGEIALHPCADWSLQGRGLDGSNAAPAPVRTQLSTCGGNGSSWSQAEAHRATSRCRVGAIRLDRLGPSQAGRRRRCTMPSRFPAEGGRRNRERAESALPGVSTDQSTSCVSSN